MSTVSHCLILLELSSSAYKLVCKPMTLRTQPNLKLLAQEPPVQTYMSTIFEGLKPHLE
ncbi:hypothetical protein HALO59_160182 [Halomonas sp. 59]|nr:hypothetical protein HALO113_160824 [Halomonas sp. 113]CAD5265720.1 hypothetical protein HALO59_160182 [Halomonas sp. 59]CAD5278474.1 hypothetical protein HALOI3_210181 [Halomonas sp. I3]CAD5284492.1 hypothetical protein HALO156_30009 [Halomonas sp. 156]VXB55422.1 hypothetical protein HALO98_170182 [Halomonas titanicae]